MVCPDCKAQQHGKCPGGTWCDCQHQHPAPPAEARLGWIRQG